MQHVVVLDVGAQRERRRLRVGVEEHGRAGRAGDRRVERADLVDEVAQRALLLDPAARDDLAPALPRRQHAEHARARSPAGTSRRAAASSGWRRRTSGRRSGTRSRRRSPATAAVPQSARTTKKNSSVSIASVPVTAIPYALASRSLGPEPDHERDDRGEDDPVRRRHVDLPDSSREVWRTTSRGRKPSRIAWRVTLNAPEITAWEAMIAATVERITIGIRAQSGNSRKNGFDDAPGVSTGSARPGRGS